MKLDTKRKKILTAAIISVCVIIAVVVPMTAGMGIKDKIDYNYDYGQQLSETQVRKDVKNLIKNVENTHPVFLTGEPAQYSDAKKKIENLGAVNGKEFKYAVMEFLAVFDDLHTRVELGNYKNEKFVIRNFNLIFDINSKDLLIVNDLPQENQECIPQGARLTSINGKDYISILNAFSKIMAKENQYAHALWQRNFFEESSLEYAGVPLENDKVKYIFELDGLTYEREFTMRQSDANTPNTPGNNVAPQNFQVKTVMQDVLLIKVLSCVDDGSFDSAISEIEKHMQQGTKKVVFDLVNNSGGNDGFMNTILRTLGLECSQGQFEMRFSPTSRRYRNTVALTGSSIGDYVYKSENKYNIDLKIFMNEHTGSAALTPISRVKYSNLGEIIGRPSVQSPNFYGNMTIHSLKNSKLPYTLPISKMTYYYNGKVTDNVLMPDILVGNFSNFTDYVKFD